MKYTIEEKKAARALANRKWLLKSQYGMSLENYDNMLRSQNYGCKICGSKSIKRKGFTHFHIDHDHDTGKVRGILCDKCNKLLGSAFDDISRLEKMIKYLK